MLPRHDPDILEIETMQRNENKKGNTLKAQSRNVNGRVISKEYLQSLKLLAFW